MADVQVNYNRDDIITILRDLEMIVCSFGRIGSFHSDMTKEEYYKASSDFLDEWDVARRLARARSILNSVFSDELDPEDEMSEIERLVEDVPHWLFEKRKPPKNFKFKW